MASRQGPGPVPGHPQKHDPAWKHVQILSMNGERRKLKCIYCGKIFQGGGIHRIKEHLAGQKGNASRCPRVLPEVQLLMRESLEGSLVKRKKKQKLVEEVGSLNPTPICMVDTFANQGEMETGLQLLVDGLDPTSALPIKKEEEGDAKTSEKRKRGRPKLTSPPPPLPAPHPLPMITDADTVGRVDSGLSKAKDQMLKDQANMAVGRFLYDAGIPLDAVNSVYFQRMVDALVSAGPGLEGPTYHDLRGSILKNSIEEANNILEQYKVMWGRTGCSIVADEWTTLNGRVLINFLIYCPEGTMFLKSVDASDIVESADALYELLKQVVEEVGIKNVIQVITNNAEIHVIAGKRLTETFPTMFWTPCTARCVNFMLEEFEKIQKISATIDHAQAITRFIYNHSMVLNMMRKFTDGKELLLPSISRAATNFFALHNMVALKDNLKAMFASQEWVDCQYSKSRGGIVASGLVVSDPFWSQCTTIVNLTEPLLRVLKMVNSDERPAMGYIFESMYRVKEAIKNELKSKAEYMLYWNIIDSQWDSLIHRPLHAAGFFLNPQFFYSIKGEVHNEIMSGVLDCIERLVPDTKVQDKINKELSSYKNAAGDFGRKIADRARYSLPPADWWSTYGGSCPNLTRLAIRILSQTCSASGFHRDHIPLEQIHSQIKNRLEHQRLKDLVFVQYNLRLQERRCKKELSDPIAFDKMDILEGWVMEELSEGEGDLDLGWTALDQPVATGANLASANDEDPVGLVSGYEDEEIYTGGKDEMGGEDDGRI
ncbi:uncharacterized protein [Aristolochia californica]|uniref:uncharacterized protein n=1 Tax=Aristolochia californica TaxID=171875 RepID=UPI0035E22A2F